MRLPRSSPSVEHPRSGGSVAPTPPAAIRPQTASFWFCAKKPLACGLACGPGGRCPAECPNCVGGKCRAD